MLETLGKTQQNLLKALLANKAGLPIDALAGALGITRTAVRQHVTVLEGLGYLTKKQAGSTGGRPGQHYLLTQKGHDLFPKQYSLFSEILLRAVGAEKGAEGLAAWLEKLGGEVALTFRDRTANRPLTERVTEAVAIMNSLAYEARAVETGDEVPAIEAENCVYHDLAAENRSVCRFDLALLSGLTGAEVIHEKCIQEGHNVCRFCFKNR